MRLFLYYTYTASMLLVAAIAMVAMLWCDLSHRRVDNGPPLFPLWGTHGVHTFDLVVLGIEGVLVLLLSVTLLAGFSRGRQG